MRRSTAGTVQIPSAAVDRVLNAKRNKDPFQRDSARDSGQADWFRMEATGTGTTEIYIYDEIGFWGTTASEFQQIVSTIDTPRIDLHLNSPGGEIFDGVAIYNALKMHKAYVTVYVDSLAASAASFIAQAGDKVIVLHGAMMMIHDASGLCWGNAQDMSDTADLLGKLSNNIADIYAQRTGDSVEAWRALMQEEVWYTAQEAVDAGLADEVVNVEPASGTATNSWNLSVFNYAGRSKAPSPVEVRRSIQNKASKESLVKPGLKNEEGGVVTPPPVPAVAPPAEGEQSAASEEGASAPVAEEGAEVTPAEGATAADQPAPEGVPANRASGVAYVINGVKVTDPAKVQAHINSLEGSHREAKEGNRKAFVKQLCDDKKILASQVTSLEEFVLDPDLTDRQYDRWAASWDAASPLATLGRQLGGGPGNGGNTAETNSLDQGLQDAKEIVQSNMRASMPKDRLEATASWLKLVAAGFDPNTLRESK